MTSALELQKLIDKVKNKLLTKNIDLLDYDKAIKCLQQTVNPGLCIRIYEEYINY